MRTLSLAFACLSLYGCTDSSSAPPADGATDMIQPVGVAMEAACSDTLDSIYADPGMLPGEGGAILKCAKDKDVPRSDLQAILDQSHFLSRAIDGGAHFYRVLYQTERGTTPAVPGYSSALVLLPDTPRAAQLPVVVLSHATRGEAANCGPSKLDPSDDPVNADFVRIAYSLAGYGYAVMAPDNAGYANWNAAGNPLPGFISAPDEGKSALDGARALRKLIPSSLTDQVVMVGHSQGGHATLSAMALLGSYGQGVNLTAAVVESPLWIHPRTFGAVVALASSYPFSTNASVNLYALWYHYAEAELYDGQGHGVDLFAASKRDAVKAYVDATCFPPDLSGLSALGSNLGDLFDPTFVNSVPQVAAGFQADCAGGDALCTKWMQRYTDDRPHITGSALQIPIFFLWGSGDTTLASDRISCAIDRLKSDGATIDTLCVDPGVSHNDITGTRADVVADWIAQKTLGGPAPAACPASTIEDAMGMPAVCSALPPNSP